METAPEYSVFFTGGFYYCASIYFIKETAPSTKSNFSFNVCSI
jgi:hypothetical protein